MENLDTLGSATSRDPPLVHNSASREENVEHAQWRVQVLRGLLAIHRILPSVGTERNQQDHEWKVREGEYLVRLRTAEYEFDQATRPCAPDARSNGVTPLEMAAGPTRRSHR